MLIKSGFFLLLVAVFQVSTKYVEPDFIENVIKRESESSSSLSRIVSGWPAQPGQHPHQAALRMVDPTGTVSGCGGSIVSREWVVTAAHCTAGRITVVVRGGVVSLTNPEYIFETTEWYNHPSYDSSLPGVVQTNDISILKLQRPVVYTRLLKSIRIQPSADAFRNYDGEQVYASGHGRTWTNGATSEVLNWVYLFAISNAACVGTYGGALIVDSAICTRFYNVTSQSICQGDSGGPLVHVGPDGVPTLIGVASFVAGGDFGCHSGLPAGFIRPGPFLSWFKEVTGVDFENLQEDDDSGEDDNPTTTTPQTTTTTAQTTTTTAPTTTAQTTTAPTTTAQTTTAQTTTTTPQTPTTTTPQPTTTTTSPKPEEDSEEDDSDSSESNEDDDLPQLIKHLQVKVKVKVNINKYGSKLEVEKDKEKEVKKHH